MFISNQNLLLNVAEESLYLYFVENNSVDFYKYLIRKFPDDFQNDGKQLRDLSNQERQYLMSLLKKELKST
jgi:hypothetical protein